MFMYLGDTILICMTIWTLCRQSTSYDNRKPKVSNANSLKACWLSKHVISCLATLFKATFRATCHTFKTLVLNPTNETPRSSPCVCFPPIHSYTIPYLILSVDLPSCGLANKFASVLFFTDTLVCLNIFKRTCATKSSLYLKLKSSLKLIVCYPKVSSHALQQTMHISSIENKGIMSRFMGIVRYLTCDIWWLNPSIRITRRKSWTSDACKHPKNVLCLVVMSNFISIF